MTAPAPPGPHATGVRDLLDAQLPAAVAVAIGERPADSQLCVVLYPDPGMPEGSLGDRYRDLLMEIQATCVGTGVDQVLDLAGRVRTVLLTLLPTIAGRTVQPLWEVVTGERVRPDNDVNPPLWYLPLVFQMRTEPGP